MPMLTTGPYPAGFEPSKDGWPRGSGSPREERQRAPADKGQVAASGAKRMTKESIRTVLLVEDNPADARSLREMLDKGGRTKPN